MPVVLNPYLHFRSRAREAMEFYRDVLGGELELSTFGDFGAAQDASEADLVMHARLISDAGFVLMGSDTPPRMPLTDGDTVSVSLGGEDGEALQRWWDGLSGGATVTVPLTASPWGDRFGMLTDRYGVRWMVNIAAGADTGS